MKKVKSLKTDVYGCKVTITANNVHIKDSYKISDCKKIVEALNSLKEYVDDHSAEMVTPFDKRSINSMKDEWLAHNNLYRLGYKKEQTKDLDLNYPQKWYAPIVYWLLSTVVL